MSIIDAVNLTKVFRVPKKDPGLCGAVKSTTIKLLTGILLTWLIPFGLASYYPAQYLLDRVSSPAAWAAPVVGGLFLYGAYQIWLFGLRHYASTGS